MSRPVKQELERLKEFYLGVVKGIFPELLEKTTIGWIVHYAIDVGVISVRCKVDVKFTPELWHRRRELLDALQQEINIGLYVSHPPQWWNYLQHAKLDGADKPDPCKHFFGNFGYFRDYYVQPDDLPEELSRERQVLVARRQIIWDINALAKEMGGWDNNVIVRDPASARRMMRKMIKLTESAEPSEQFSEDAQMTIQRILAFLGLPEDLKVFEWERVRAE